MSLTSSIIRSDFNHQKRILQSNLDDLIALLSRLQAENGNVVQHIENAMESLKHCNSNLEDAIAILVNGS